MLVPIAVEQGCPDEQNLRQFLDHALSEHDERHVQEHLDQCGSCLSALEGMVGSLTGLAEAAAAAARPTNGTTPMGSTVLLPSRYRVVQELGRGTYGVVYRVHDSVLDRPAAVKVPRRAAIRAAGGVDLYLKEAKALARLNHPNIVKVFDALPNAGNSCAIVSEFIEGRNLAVRLQEGRPRFAESARLVATIAEALQHAHEQGIIHRDVKPANILLDTAGRPYLTDFGLALKECEIGSGPTFLGTPAYMSPEQARGEGHRVDGRTDIFSLGVILFEALTGRRPFLAESRSDLLDLIANVDAPAARQKDGSVPAELERICAKALARSLQDRYSSAKALAEDLHAWLRSEGAGTASDLGSKRTSITFENLPGSGTAMGGSTAGNWLGGFELRGRLGAGGMGVVYRAWQPSEQREVALKCLRRGDEVSQRRFINEIRALAKVSHPHLVQIYTSGASDHQHFYAMELIDGASFKSLFYQLRAAQTPDENAWNSALGEASDEARQHEQRLDAPAVSPDEQTVDAQDPADFIEAAPEKLCESQFYVRQMAAIVRDIARAAQALHEKGVVHRDIKPDNILLAREGARAVLMDLGVAKLTRSDDGQVTTAREFVGSLRYASPEQVLDSRHVDFRSDVYSLGATLWELLTLRPLYGIGRDVHDAKAMLTIEVEEPEQVRKYNRAAPKDLEAIVHKCLEKSPDKRYSTAAELAEDLERFLEGQAVQARSIGPVARLGRRWRRRPVAPTLAISLAMMALALVAAVIPWPQRDPNVLRIGIKPWVGFSPLAVADKLKLCGPIDLEFVWINDIGEALRRLDMDQIDVVLCPLESHVYARAAGYPTKAILQLDASHEADAVVTRRRDGFESFADLRGKRIAYMQMDAPHFLLLNLCDRHRLAPADFEAWIPTSAKEAVRMLNEGEVDAAVSYEPYLHEVHEGQLLATSGGADEGHGPAIVDMLTMHERYLTAANRSKVQALMKGWFEAVDRLNRLEPEAIDAACELLGGPKGPPKTRAQYLKMAAANQMTYSTRADNLRFFQSDAHGSEFLRRMAAAQDRLERHGLVGQRIDPQEADGSAILLEGFEE